MPSPGYADVGELLRRLTDAGVEFIVVGGAAAVFHGGKGSMENASVAPAGRRQRRKGRSTQS